MFVSQKMRMVCSVSSVAATAWLLVLLCDPVAGGSTWAPLGQKMCRGGEFGASVGYKTTSSGTQVMAVSSPLYWNTRLNQGSVEFFSLNTGSCLWESYRPSIVGSNTEDRLGYSLALSCDAQTIAVAGDLASGQNRLGFVQVYAWYNGAWVTKGSPILDPSPYGPNIPTSFGWFVELSCDGTVLSVLSGVGIFVFLYNDTSSKWELSRSWQGGDYISALSLGPGPVRLAIGQNEFDGAQGFPLQVLELQSDNKWIQLGNDITDADGFLSSHVAISANGTRVVVANTFDSPGSILIYDLVNNAAWTRVPGDGIDLQTDGNPIAVSPDGSTVYEVLQTGLQAYRSVNFPDAPPSTGFQPEWIPFGSSAIPWPGTNPTYADLSSTGSIVVMGATAAGKGSVQANFYPDSNELLDCYPNPASAATQECVAPPTPPTVNQFQIVGGSSLFVDNDQAKAAAGYTFGAFAFVVANIVIVMGFMAIKMASSKSANNNNNNNNNNATTSAAAAAASAPPPTMQDIEETEMEPLQKPSSASASMAKKEHEPSEVEITFNKHQASAPEEDEERGTHP